MLGYRNYDSSDRYLFLRVLDSSTPISSKMRNTFGSQAICCKNFKIGLYSRDTLTRFSVEVLAVTNVPYIAKHNPGLIFINQTSQ